jgi:drug/metabolite transporter (DMT)-like permease
VIKLALSELHPYVVNALRFAVSAVALGLAHGATSRPDSRTDGSRGPSRFWLPMRVAPWRIVGLGLLGYVGYQVCFILGVNLTTAGSAGLIIGSAPALTALFARLFKIERLSAAAWAGLLISLAGMAVVILFGPHDPNETVDEGQRLVWGNLLMGVAAILWSLYTVVSRPVMDSGASPTGAAFFGVIVALPFLFGFGWLEAGGIEWGAVSATAWGAIVFSGGLSTGLAYAVWNEAVKAVGPSHTAAFTNLVPFLAVASGALMLGEPVTLAQVAGGALIIGGLVLMRRARRAASASA